MNWFVWSSRSANNITGLLFFQSGEHRFRAFGQRRGLLARYLSGHIVDPPWKGLYVIGNREESSRLNYVRIRDTRALEDGLLRLTGGVSFYNSLVEIRDTKIIGTTAEDALNLIDSEFILDNIEISSTTSDAFDSDFSQGTIVDSSFLDVGGDGVDFSGSDVYIKDAYFNNIRDKAVSVGESSSIDLKNIGMNNVGVGIASKDGSSVNASSIEINRFKLYAAMTYVKKDFYGQPSFKGIDIDINPIKKDAFVAQEKTLMSVNYKLIEPEKVDIDNLYQNEVMRK